MVWKKLAEGLSRLINLDQRIERNRSDINVLQVQVRELTAAVQHLAYELQRLRENEAHEREKMALRLENELLRFERRLPSPRSDEKE